MNFREEHGFQGVCPGLRNKRGRPDPFDSPTHQKAEWADQPFLLSPNQQFIPWNLTGWPRENGCRRFRRVALFIYLDA